MKTSFHNSELPRRRTLELQKKVRLYTEEITELAKKNDYSKPESALFVAGDKTYQSSLKKALSPYKNTKHVILVGIGGSSLGTEAVYQALSHKTSPLLTVIDAVDKDAIHKLEVLIEGSRNPQDIVVTVISKSGTTTETILNASKVVEILERKYGEKIRKQIIFIGDRNTSFMRSGAQKKILCLPIQNSIGGRYSVFTAAGIVPLTLLGIDIASLRKGALQAVSKKKELRQRAKSALILAQHAEEGVHTVNFFAFNKRLEKSGFWYRQLLAESIGKKMTTKGTTFSHQLLPLVSTSVDLHSMAQLYLSGYKNMYTHFVYYNEHHPFHIRTSHWIIRHVPFLRGKKFDEVNEAIIRGVLKAYDGQKLAYAYTELAKCSAQEIGFLLGSLMCEVMYLAYLLNVDAFDQPAVELYKKHTRKTLDA